ncbi:MAG: MFS transporter [Caldilineales bacterium]|nr:MFS transporter [Caldilineales bacterium]
MHKNRWIAVVIFFTFMLLHQSDKLLIGPLTTPIMETFGIDEVAMGAVFTGALILGAIMYPVWGYLYDRYSRPRLLALASAIWGSTTWLSAIAPTYPSFLATRATTGIDDSSYPGIYSLISDYFGPELRGKIYGLLQLTQPLGYLVGLIAATLLSGLMGWRAVFYITGSLGLILAVFIFFFVKDAPRGQAEPEMAGIDEQVEYKFEWGKARGLFRKRSLLLLYAQGFVGVFPWNIITYWFFRYLETERDYSEGAILMTMAPAILVLAFGYFLGGVLGDFFFKRTPRGRLLVALTGVLSGAVLLFLTMNVPVENQSLFMILMLATAIFIPLAAPNVLSTVYDITLPEVRSTALSVQYFIESAGAAAAPLLAGIIATQSTLGNAILSLSVVAWLLGAVFLAVTAYLAPADIHSLREEMGRRAKVEIALQDAQTSPA